ncbi:hypothetical protein [Nocardia sp. NPDC048505]|uniref:hypothetical protein n=1 Tax=unclassified Nocardia TaxID=2637762 RepID=UPI0033C659FD
MRLPAPADLEARRVRRLIERARRAGYRMIAAGAGRWVLLDIDDDSAEVTAGDPAQIESWLDS